MSGIGGKEEIEGKEKMYWNEEEKQFIVYLFAVIMTIYTEANGYDNNKKVHYWDRKDDVWKQMIK